MKPNITYPKVSSLSGRCLARLLAGEELMHRSLDEVLGTYRLAAYVHYLQANHGWPIQRSEIVKLTQDPAGRKAGYMCYSLDGGVIEWAGVEGQAYTDDVLRLESKRIVEREVATSLPTEKKSSELNPLNKHHSTSGVSVETGCSDGDN